VQLNLLQLRGTLRRLQQHLVTHNNREISALTVKRVTRFSIFAAQHSTYPTFSLPRED